MVGLMELETNIPYIRLPKYFIMWNSHLSVTEGAWH
jgi:hypothetical protein